MWNYIYTKMLAHRNSKIMNADILLTYGEAVDRINLVIGKIRLEKYRYTKVVILTENPIYAFIGIMVAWGIHAVAIPLSFNYGNLNCKKALTLAEPDLIITDCPNNLLISEWCTNVYNIESESYFKKVPNVLTKEKIDSDIVLIMCTSGTTGMPKGVMLKKKGVITNVEDIEEYFGLNQKDSILITRPLYHCAVLTGELLVSLCVGANIIFYSNGYNPMEIGSVINDEKITVMGGTPNLIYHIGKVLNKRSSNCIKKLAISGECMSIEIAASIRKCFPLVDIFHVYGLTEASPRVCYLPASLFDKYPESTGIPLKHVECKIMSERGEVSKGDENGILYVRGQSIMAGYYKNEQLTNKVLRDGWLITHDIACFNSEGFICIKGRADDMIIKGGMNIYPKEIENIVCKLDFVDEVIAEGFKSDLGDKIVLFIVLNEPKSKKEVMMELVNYLPKYQIPDNIILLKQLPKNGSQKIDRKELKRIYGRFVSGE